MEWKLMLHDSHGHGNKCLLRNACGDGKKSAGVVLFDVYVGSGGPAAVKIVFKNAEGYLLRFD